jgi:phospholipid/cholesterol/gamma-HCH transport system substrate-binding protein
METKANYVAVGAFVLTCVLGMVVALMWLAGAQYSEEYKHYVTYFSGAVTGLGKDTVVRYNGIDVGRVKQLTFDPDDPKRVIVQMDVDPSLKLHQDSIASIASQGLTGGSYVEIDGGDRNSPLLKAKEGQDYPVIASKQSTLQQLEDSAPQLVAKLNKAGDRLNDLLSDQNRKAIAGILDNLNATTGVIANHQADLDRTLSNLASASQSLNASLVELHGTLGDADKILKGNTVAQIGQLVAQTRGLVESLRRLSDQFNREPTRLIFGDRKEGYTPQ